MVIPAYNAEATLEESLRSVACQSYSNLEIIIVDDGSTDGTREIATRFCTSDERGRLVSIGNGGVGAARNAGIAAAAGEFVAFLDADDLWQPEKIRKQVEKALSRPDAGFIYTFYARIDDRGRNLPAPVQYQVEGYAFWRHLYWNFVGCGSNILARRKAVTQAGGFRSGAGTQGCEDHLLQLEIAASYPIACVPEALVCYRDRSNSMSSDQERMFRAWREAVHLLRSRGHMGRNRVTSWTYSRACWGLAIGSLRRRRVARAAWQFAWAVYADPPRTMLNAGRVLTRLFGRSRAADEQVSYALDRRRLSRLEALDAAARIPVNPRRDGG